jgi:hypothetical protein
MNRQLLTVLVAVVASCILAACGSSSSSSSSSTRASTSGASAGRAKFAACMKAHGVTVPPRPGGGGGSGRGAPGGGGPGFFGGGGARPGLAGNPKLQAAFRACSGTVPGRRLGSRPRRTAIETFVTCVRKHGYQLPQPNFSGRGSVFPARIARNPKFQAASRACASALRPPAGSAGGGAPPNA